MKKNEVKEEPKNSTKNTRNTKSGTSTKSKKSSTGSTTKKTDLKKEVKKEAVIIEEEAKTETIDEVEFTEEVSSQDIVKEKKEGLKKSDGLLILALIVVVILGCFVLKGKPVELSYELPLTLSGEAGLKELSYAEYQEKIDNDESFVLIIERATCSHCVNFMPVAESFANDNQVPMYYVDTDTFSDEDWASFEESNSFLKKNSDKWGTPTTVVLAGSEAVDYIEGETTADELLELYQEYFDMESE